MPLISRKLAAIDDNDQEDVRKPKRQSRRILSTFTADAILDWLVYPMILYVQFATTMYWQMKQGVLELEWTAVTVDVLLFSLVAGVYRQILRQHPYESLSLLLLPEIFTNILLAMVVFGSIVTAYKTLKSFTYLLLIIGLIFGVQLHDQDRNVQNSDYHLLDDYDEEGSDDEDWIC